MPNDGKTMNQDQKNKNLQQQKPQADRDSQGGGREPQRNRGQQGQQGGPQAGDRDGVRQARQAYVNKGSFNAEHEGSQQQVGNDAAVGNDEQVKRGNDLDDVSGEITERNPRQGKAEIDKDRR